jgi:hypothetical protein
MRIARVSLAAAAIRALAAFAIVVVLGAALGGVTAWAAPSKGLSLEQIRGVMRAHARDFNACLAASSRRNKPLHGPFLYQIDVDSHGKVTAARPFQPSGAAAFDRCVTGVLLRVRFPGGPASVETPLVFDAS